MTSASGGEADALRNDIEVSDGTPVTPLKGSLQIPDLIPEKPNRNTVTNCQSRGLTTFSRKYITRTGGKG